MLEDWFRDHTGLYTDFLDRMRASALEMADIPIMFDEAKLPEPAWAGVPYAPFDSVALYTMIKSHRPRRYLEIGSGITTCFAYRAIRAAGLTTSVTSIDPEPRTTIDAICDVTVRDGLETCDIAIFDELEAGDILFFDGSHRSFMNSDVTVFMIDVLPRLKPGVIVHVHDILLPYDYPESFRHWYWNEQYMLAVYLMGNKHRISPLLPTAFICRDAAFEAAHVYPMLDLGKYNDGWRGGGAMWFTHID
jgi:predicted O-methyltransferase YrrM